jgi:hypothetical protein
MRHRRDRRRLRDLSEGFDKAEAERGHDDSTDTE